jgi:hypothetical protein
MALFTAVTGSFGLIVIALVMQLTVRAFVRGELPPNGMLGIRTQTTKRSEAAWRAGHAAAVPGLRVIALVAVAGAILPVVLALALGARSDSASKATDVALVLAYAVVILLLARAVCLANSAASKAG